MKRSKGLSDARRQGAQDRQEFNFISGLVRRLGRQPLSGRRANMRGTAEELEAALCAPCWSSIDAHEAQIETSMARSSFAQQALVRLRLVWIAPISLIKGGGQRRNIPDWSLVDAGGVIPPWFLKTVWTASPVGICGIPAAVSTMAVSRTIFSSINSPVCRQGSPRRSFGFWERKAPRARSNRSSIARGNIACLRSTRQDFVAEWEGLFGKVKA